MEAPGGAASLYTYDTLDRLDTIARAIGDEVFSKSTTYDRFGRVATLTYPSGAGVAPFAVKNEYDPYGHLTKVWDPSNGSRGEVFYWQLTKYGVSDSVLNAAGLSKRAEKQVRAFNRRAAGTYTYESSVVQVIPSRPGARAAAYSTERDLVYDYKALERRKPEGKEKP